MFTIISKILLVTVSLFLPSVVLAATRSGSDCNCYFGSGSGCQEVFMRFKPMHDRAGRHSYIQETIPFYSVVGRRLPLVIIQSIKGTAAQGDTAAFYNLPSTSKTVDTFSDDLVSIVATHIYQTQTINVTWNQDFVSFTHGHLYVHDINIIVDDGALGIQGTLTFNFLSGLTLTSDTFTIYKMPAPNTNTDPKMILQFEATGFFYSPVQRLGGAEDLTNVVVGKPLPSFTVQVVDVGGLPLGLENTKKLIAVGEYVGNQVIDPATGAAVTRTLTVYGGEATIQGNIATFTGLTLDSSTVLSVPFQILFYVEGRIQTVFVKTQELRATATPVTGSLLTLQGPETSFLNSVSPTTKSIEQGKAIPPIRIALQDSAFQLDTSVSGLIITASSMEGELSGGVAALQDGEAVFSNLIFTSNYASPASVYGPQGSGPLPPPWPVSITFTAGRQGIIPVQGKSIVSPLMNLTGSWGTGRSTFRFRPYDSFLTYEGQSRFIDEGIKMPPIVFEVVDTANQRELVGGFWVNVVATPVSMSGITRVQSVAGLIQFDDLRLLRSDATLNEQVIELVFFSDSANTGDYQTTLATSRITVLRFTSGEVSMRFEEFPTSVVNEANFPNFATQQVSLPPLVIEVLNSAGQVDQDANEVQIVGTSSVFLTSAKAVTHRGRAVFPRITFGAPGTSRVTFTATTLRNLPINNQTLSSGYFSVVGSRLPMFRLRFHPNGHVKYAGQRVRASSISVLPKIGIQVVSSQHEVETDMAQLSRLQIKVTLNGGVSGRVYGPFDFSAADSTAWVTGITLDPSLGNPAVLGLVFTCVYPNSTDFTQLSPTYRPLVLGTSISSGEVYMAPTTGQPMLLNIAPAQLTERDLWGNLRPIVTNISGPNASTSVQDQQPEILEVQGANSLSEEYNELTTEIPLLYVGQAFQRHEYRRSTKVHVGVEMIRADGVYMVPSATFGDNLISASSTDTMRNATVPIGGAQTTVGNVTTVTVPVGAFAPNASFSTLQFKTDTYITDFFTLITFTSPWDLYTQYASPIRTGPFYYDAVQTDLDEPVVVVEVALMEPVFALDRWLSALVEVTALNLNRIEVIKVRPTGAATTGYALTFKGTRIEFKFLSPTTDSAEKASSRELADSFLAMKTDECQATSLRIHNKFYRQDQSSCDVYQIEDQLHAARRCVSTSSPAERCNCHMPMFEILGEKCKAVDQMQLVCSELQRCASDLINNVCFDFEVAVYLLYLRIAGGVLGSCLGFLLFYLWKQGAFEKNKNKYKIKKGRQLAKKKGAISLRMKTEDADPYAILI